MTITEMVVLPEAATVDHRHSGDATKSTTAIANNLYRPVCQNV